MALPCPRTHDIEELLLISSEIDGSLKQLGLPAEELSAYAVEIRYDAEFWPDQETGKRALEHVEKLWAALKGMFPPEMMQTTD